MGRKGSEAINYVDKALTELINGKKVTTAQTKPYGCNVKYKKAPAFTLPTFDGKKVSLDDYKGKTVVLEWFNDQCPFVKHHYEKAATMTKLANKYRDKQIVWLAINSTNHTTDKQNTVFAEQHKLPYPILDDRPGKVGRAYGAKTTPHIFVIDAKGNVVYSGAIDNSPMGRNSGSRVNYVDKALSQLIDAQSITTPATKPYGCNVKYPKKKAR